MTSAISVRSGVNMESRNSRVIWLTLNGRPWPKGVRSSRAQKLRRLGTITIMRPPSASTRHTSRSIARNASLDSTACTSSTRSMERSGSGMCVSSPSAVALRASGQWSTPCSAGITAMVRSASPCHRPR